MNNVVLVTSFRNDMYFPANNLMIVVSSFGLMDQSNFNVVHMACLISI